MNQNTQLTNPHAPRATSLLDFARRIWKNRQLVLQMTKREITSRYKGSVVGLAWSILNPIFMLAVYTFVFSVVFRARWGVGGQDDKMQFAALLFVGMIVHSLFAEVLNRAPNLILSNVNYVKKVVFPIEILPITSVLVSLFYSLISLAVLSFSLVIFNGYLNWTIVFIPIVLLPFIVLILGFSLALASIGVFLRDVSQVMTMFTTILMFLSPVFYPLSAVPTKYIPLIMANPLTFIIQQAREVLILGNLPDWYGLFIYTSFSFLVAWVGYALFQKTRKGFSDVL